MVESWSVMKLRVLAEADSSALLRTLERFQNLGIVPRRVITEFTTADTMSIQVDVCGLDESRLTLIANKLAQVPSVLRAYWHYA